MARKSATAEPPTVYECLESHWAGAGAGTNFATFYRQGARLTVPAGDEPRNPAYWMPFGTSDEERTRRRMQLLGKGDVPPADREAAPVAVRLMRAVKPISASTSTVAPGITLAGMTGGPELALIQINPGDTLPADHPLVAKFEDAFEPVEAE
jgi:hypothetical protein